MSAEGLPRGASGAPVGAGACVVLDAGDPAIDRREFARAIADVLHGRVAELAHDRNAVCYRVRLARPDGDPVAAVLKVPRPGQQRTNADLTFAGEAAILAALPAAGFVAAPSLLARVVAAGRHYLFMTDVPGAHPDPRDHPLDDRALHDILERLFEMDARGLMHYDLKPANILVHEGRATFVDFEFSRFRDHAETYTPEAAAWCEDFNAAGNPHFPARSNVANFEFRALDRYLDELAMEGRAADVLLLDWLRAKSAWHRRMSAFLAGFPAATIDRMASAGRLTPEAVRAKLAAASAHERILVALYARPSDVVARVERRLMAFRCAVFERRAGEASRLRREVLAEIRPGAPQAGPLPDAYAMAVLRILALVGRSVHPAGSRRST